VFCFGEEVDKYEDGKVVKHSGAWWADEKDSKVRLVRPGTVLLDSRYYQEIAPNTRDRAEHVADDVTLETPAGTFKNCLNVEETTPLEPGERGYKVYAPGVGLVQDEGLKLMSDRTGKQRIGRRCAVGGRSGSSGHNRNLQRSPWSAGASGDHLQRQRLRMRRMFET